MYTLTLNAATYEELAQQVIDLKGGFGASPAPAPAPRDEPSVEELLTTLRGKLRSQNLDVVVKNIQKAVDEVEEALKQNAFGDDRIVSISPGSPGGSATAGSPPVARKKSNGGATKITKETAAAALNAETPAGRKARCVAELQTMFANGKKAEVLKILAELGDGAKTFGAVPEENFAAISDALVTMV